MGLAGSLTLLCSCWLLVKGAISDYTDKDARRGNNVDEGGEERGGQVAQSVACSLVGT